MAYRVGRFCILGGGGRVWNAHEKSLKRVGYKCKFFSSLRLKIATAPCFGKKHENLLVVLHLFFGWWSSWPWVVVLTQQNPGYQGFLLTYGCYFIVIAIVIPINNPRALVYSNHYPSYSHPLSKIIYLDIHCCSTDNFFLICHGILPFYHHIPSCLLVKSQFSLIFDGYPLVNLQFDPENHQFSGNRSFNHFQPRLMPGSSC